MAGKGLHKSPLAAQSCYYYLVPKLLHTRSPPGAGLSTELSWLSVCLGLHLLGQAGQRWITPQKSPPPNPCVRIKIQGQGGEGACPDETARDGHGRTSGRLDLMCNSESWVGLHVPTHVHSPLSSSHLASPPPKTHTPEFTTRPRLPRSCSGPHGPTRLPPRELTSQMADKEEQVMK